ncbi:MAG: hypothetical protein ABIH23_13885 [bacterium]
MNRAHIFITIFILIGLGFVLIASAQVTAVRTLPGEICLPGERLKTIIEVIGDPGAIIIVETPPAEWTIRASSGGKLSDGVITWSLETFDGAETLVYFVTSPSTATGEAVFSGVVDDQEIGGMSRMTAYEVPADVRLPQTTGPFAIGTFLAHLIDESRLEQITHEDPSDNRELMVQVWYPAVIQDSRQPGSIYPEFDAVQPYLEAYYSSYGVPSVFCDGLRVPVGNAVRDARVLDIGLQYPVLIFSHGNGGSRRQNVSLFEELASCGYVVASIDHTYNATVVQFPDGRVIPNRVSGSDSLHEQDVRFVLDELEKINVGHDFEVFTGLLDLERVGVFGMSLGGAVTTLTMQDDPRFKAGVVLDMEFRMINRGLDQPVMFLHDGNSPGDPSNLESALRGGGYACKIRGTAHIDFTDLPILWKLFSLPGKYPVQSEANDPVRVSRIIADYTLAFFDKILKGQHVPLLDCPSSDYPEVEFTIYGEPQGLSGISDEEWVLY